MVTFWSALILGLILIPYSVFCTWVIRIWILYGIKKSIEGQVSKVANMVGRGTKQNDPGRTTESDKAT